MLVVTDRTFSWPAASAEHAAHGESGQPRSARIAGVQKVLDKHSITSRAVKARRRVLRRNSPGPGRHRHHGRGILRNGVSAQKPVVAKGLDLFASREGRRRHLQQVSANTPLRSPRWRSRSNKKRQEHTVLKKAGEFIKNISA